jgi:hypothetical protein
VIDDQDHIGLAFVKGCERIVDIPRRLVGLPDQEYGVDAASVMPRALMKLIGFFLAKAATEPGPENLDIVVAKFGDTFPEGPQ